MQPATALSILGVAALLGGSDLTADEFAKLHPALMRPEKWSTIPWHARILEAREAAFKEKKPLFVWVMDGKPLGSV